jgi:hypothetical protein
MCVVSPKPLARYKKTGIAPVFLHWRKQKIGSQSRTDFCYLSEKAKRGNTRDEQEQANSDAGEDCPHEGGRFFCGTGRGLNLFKHAW